MTNTERKNITQPSDWWEAFRKQASKEGKTLSEWMGECCVANLPPESAKKIGNRPAAHRPTALESK